MVKTRLKSYSVDRMQSSSETKDYNAVQRQQLERRKLRRCKPVKAKVVAHTKENWLMPDVASKLKEVFGSK